MICEQALVSYIVDTANEQEERVRALANITNLNGKCAKNLYSTDFFVESYDHNNLYACELRYFNLSKTDFLELVVN